MEEINGYEVLRLQNPAPLHTSEAYRSDKASTDIQVATAHMYPRDLARCMNNAIAIATMDYETAMSCRYALPRGNKPIMGPSVHLAKIIAQQYGNIRAEAKVVDVTDSHVISRGTAWDLENNYAVSFEVRRSIKNKNGQRFNDDMITVTGNAANSIAYRNAVLTLVPNAVVNKVYNAAQRCITGDLSDEDKLLARRTKAVQHFKEEYGITEEELIKLCGKTTIAQIRADQISLLVGLQQALRDGDTTVEEVMAPIRNSKEVKANKLTDVASRAMKKHAKKVAEDVEVAEEVLEEIPNANE